MITIKSMPVTISIPSSHVKAIFIAFMEFFILILRQKEPARNTELYVSKSHLTFLNFLKNMILCFEDRTIILISTSNASTQLVFTAFREFYRWFN